MKRSESVFHVCLINPPVLTVLEPWYDTPDFGRTGLAYLAAYLLQHTDYKVTIIDAKLERLDFNEVIDKIKKTQPDVVGLTAFTNEIKPAAYQAALIKRYNDNITTIIGGVHVTSIPKETLLEFPFFDIGVVGEGEQTLLELCNHLKYGDSELHSIDGIVFREGAEVIQTKTRDRIADQNSLPMPAWDLMPASQTYYIQTLRGCPYNCNFCMNPNGKFVRKRSPENVIHEILYIIEKFRPGRISFGDEIFSVDIPRTHELLDLMIQHQIGDQVEWDVQTHVNYVDEELFKKFKLAKVTRVELGVETGDEEILRKMGKGTSIDKIMKACQWGKKHGVQIGTFMLFGQPNETLSSLKKTIDIAVKINPTLPMFGLMTPYPGTKVAAMAAKEEGGYRLLTTDWDEYNKQIGGAMEFANLSRKQIETMQIIAYLSVFIKNYRFKDLFKFLWEYRIGAYHVLKKMIFRKKNNNASDYKPPFYDEILSPKGYTIHSEIFISSRDKWNNIQNSSLKDLKRKLSE